MLRKSVVNNPSLRIAILGAGFIGKNLLRSYVSSGHELRVLDRNSCPDEFLYSTHWHKGSFDNSKDIVSTIAGADVVFHLISSTVPADQIDENREIMTNVIQTINLLRLCIEHKIGRLIFMSSASVYGRIKTLPIKESDETNPISSHGIHKLTIEKYVDLFNYKYGLDVKIMRLSNPYGWGQNLFGRQGFIAIAIGKIISGNPIIVTGDGSAIRDYVHIDDVVKACQLLGNTNSKEILFNIGSGVGITINDVLVKIKRIVDRPFEVSYVNPRAGDILASVLDISKAKSLLSFEPSIKFNEGLKQYLRRVVSANGQQHLDSFRR